MNFEFLNSKYSKRLESKTEMVAFRLMNTFEEGWSKVKVNGQWLTLVVKVNGR